MKTFIGKLLLKLLGWKMTLHGDEKNLNRCILVVAPHTHNMEFLLGNIAYWILDKPLKIIIKDAHIIYWLYHSLRTIGKYAIRGYFKRDFRLSH